MTTTIEVLKAARKKISKPENWTKGVYARDATGKSTGATHSDACSFCADGALYLGYVSVVGREERIMKTYDDAAEALHETAGEDYRSFVRFNDHPGTTHDDVLKLFDDTIERLESEAA